MTSTEPKQDVVFLEETAGADNIEKQLHDAEATGKLDVVNQQMAIQSALAEHELSTWQALKKHYKAALWSMLVSTCIIMRAYDIEVTGSLYAQPAFSKYMGSYVKGHGYEVPTQWQIAMSMGAIVGQVGGAWAAAIPMDRFGRKKTLAGYLFATIIVVFMQVFAPNRNVLTASMYLAGFIWGGYHVIAPTYASEVCPLRLRGLLTAYVSLCYTIGQLLQTGIVKAFVNRSDRWAYKIPYAIQWVWPVIILSGLIWAPESPWWEIRQNRMEAAKRSLDKLTSKSIHKQNTETLALMVKTDIYERELELGATYKDVFKGSNRRRLEICSMLFITQNFSGNPVGFTTYLLEQVGLDTNAAFDMSLGLAGVGFVATCLCAFPMAWFGRRNLWIYGLGYCVVILWVVALLSFAKGYKTHPGYPWAQASMLISLQFVYALTVGPLGYIVSSETPSTKLRAKTLSVTATINGATYLVLTVLGPVLLNPGAANAGAKTEFLFGGISLICWVWAFFRIPETGNRTYEELDTLFNLKVPARKFKSFVIDPDSQMVRTTSEKD